MDLVSSVSAAAAVMFILAYIHQRAARRASARAAAGLIGNERAAASFRFHLIPSMRTLLTRLGRAVSPRPPKGLEELIAESGAGFSTPYFQGLRCAAGLAAALLVLPLGAAALPLLPAFFALGYYLPLVILKRKRRRFLARMASDLPEAVDLMAVLCYSGESLLSALQHSAKACGHPSTRHEIENILERIRLGESTAEALRHAVHHPCRELRRFSRTLLRAEEYGAPVAETLEELASELRSGRREKERVRASRASVLILFPLVFCILPSFLLLTVGGMILGYTL